MIHKVMFTLQTLSVNADLVARAGLLERQLQDEQQRNTAQGLAALLGGRMASLEDVLRGLLQTQAAVLEHVRQRPIQPVAVAQPTPQEIQEQSRQRLIALLNQFPLN